MEVLQLLQLHYALYTYLTVLEMFILSVIALRVTVSLYLTTLCLVSLSCNQLFAVRIDVDHYIKSLITANCISSIVYVCIAGTL